MKMWGQKGGRTVIVAVYCRAFRWMRRDWWAKFRNDADLRLRSRMGVEVFLADVGAVHVGVDLRGRDIGVAEHFLDGAQVSPALKQVGGEGVPKRMGVKILDADG